MRYLKLFEGFDRLSQDQKDELKDYCETNLAYLMDEGFRIEVDQLVSGMIKVEISRDNAYNSEESLHGKSFGWSDVKDHFIPFVMILSKKYEIENVVFLSGKGKKVLSPNELEKEEEQPLRFIYILLSEKISS